MPHDALRDLVDLVARLRGPGGCPWDRAQGLPQVRAYLLEEAHETAAAIDEGDWGALREELGDLAFQLAFLCRLAEEEGAFRAEDVLRGAHAKMVERHPHVFGDEVAATADDVRRAWERRKASRQGDRSVLAGVPASLPALVAAYRLGQKAAAVGFDWPDPRSVLAKVEEELGELERALPEGEGRRTEELGDLLFALASLARHLETDPEAALAAANAKFRRRFAAVEARLAAAGERLGEPTLERLEELWQEVKRAEAAS